MFASVYKEVLFSSHSVSKYREHWFPVSVFILLIQPAIHLWKPYKIPDQSDPYTGYSRGTHKIYILRTVSTMISGPGQYHLVLIQWLASTVLFQNHGFFWLYCCFPAHVFVHSVSSPSLPHSGSYLKVNLTMCSMHSGHPGLITLRCSPSPVQS